MTDPQETEMNIGAANQLVLTVGLFAVAITLVWKGDTMHGLICIALAVPNGQQLFGLRKTTTAAIAAAVTQAMTVPPPPMPTERNK